MLAQTTFLDEMLDNLGQRQGRCFHTQGFDQADEVTDCRAGFAGQAGGRVVQTRIGAMCRLLQGFKAAATVPRAGKLTTRENAVSSSGLAISLR